MNSLDGAEWPDWSGDTAVIVATGPSAAEQPLYRARDLARFIVINNAWRLVPWADVLYASDRSFWESNEGVPEFGGLKVSASPGAAVVFPPMMTVRLLKGDRIIAEPAGTIGSGSRQGNGGSGFHAVNLAVQFGAERIVLVGFDRKQALDGCSYEFTALGVDVVNASSVSALKAYRKVDLMDALAG